MTTFYVDPNVGHNPTTGQIIPASWGDDVRNALVFFATPPACEANRSSNQSITDSTWTAIQCNAADSWDTDAFHDTVTNNTRLTVPTGFGARYCVETFVEWASSSAGYRGLRILKNGATATNLDLSDVDSAVGHRVSASVSLALAAADYIELQVFQTSGGALNCSTARFGLRFVSL